MQYFFIIIYLLGVKVSGQSINQISVTWNLLMVKSAYLDIKGKMKQSTQYLPIK